MPPPVPQDPEISLSRLGGLMFFQIFILGAFHPILSLYLQEGLRLSSSQTGFIMGMSVLSSILAPLISVHVVDRLIRAKGLFLLCQILLVASALGMGLAQGFGSFLAWFSLNALCAGPSWALLQAITFQQLQRRHGHGNHFGSIRVWGTLGWMVAGYLVTGFWLLGPRFFRGMTPAHLQASAFLIAGLGALASLGLALGLPPGKRDPSRVGAFLPEVALAPFRQRRVAVIAAAFLVASLLDKLFFFGMASFLVQQGFSQAWVPTFMTLGQVTEVVALFSLNQGLRRYSYRSLLLFGAGAQLLRFILFQADVRWMSVAGILLGGVVFACLSSVMLMYIDGHASNESRQGVHQILQLFIGGLSSLAGNLLAGYLGQIFRTQEGIDFSRFWMVAILGGLAILALLLGFFRNDPKRPDPA